MDIIFEIEMRKLQKNKSLIVMDDIVDSFDYKNKYAIMEYIIDISENHEFDLIVLTHNFDFYRSLQYRFGWDNIFIGVRDEGLIILNSDREHDPLKGWRAQLNDSVVLVASIPFVRNLSEYIGNKEIFRKLTSLLHMKDDTTRFTVSQLYVLYSEIFHKESFIDFRENGGTVFEKIDEACCISLKLEGDNLRLQNKISLAIGIRLLAEECIINLINDSDFVANIKRNQTRELIEKYKIHPDCDPKILKLMKRISIVAPDMIHINSFMFEPIIDMSGNQLKNLYMEVKNSRDESNTHS